MKTSPILLACVVLQIAGPSPIHADEFKSAGVKIHYVVEGMGEPVILIHGLYSSAMMNWNAPGITAELARHHRVIALDCRGHGQSGKPDAEGAYGTNMVEDVVRLMDHLHIAKAQIVGYSMGGMIAMKLEATHPDRVSAIVLGGMGWLKTGARMNRFWEVVNSQGSLNVPSACLHGFPALAVTEQDLEAIKVPVTIIVGDRDPCRRAFVEPLRQLRPDFPEHIIADAGHLNCIMKPDFKTQVAAALSAAPAATPK
jgi:pimeloyl-ACP methyl ester carboxylesterase